MTHDIILCSSRTEDDENVSGFYCTVHCSAYLNFYFYFGFCLEVGVNKIAMALTPLFSKMSKMLVLFKNVVVMHYMYLLIITDWFAF